MLHLKTILPVSILLGFALLTNIAQADYQNNISVFNIQSSGDNNYDSESNLLTYSYYFDKVDTSTGPWILAPFIQRSSSISFASLHQESSSNTYKSDSTSNTLSASLANKESPFVFGLSYGKGKSDMTGTSTSSAESSGPGISIGYYLQPYTLLSLGHSESKTDNITSSTTSKDKTDDISISTALLQNNGTAIYLSGQHKVMKFESGTKLKYTTIHADYYMNARLGFGASIISRTSTIRANEGMSKGINASYFIKPNLSLYAEYSTYTADESQARQDSDLIMLSGSFYF